MEEGKLTDEFRAFLETNGYFEVREENGVIMGLMKFMYTIAIVVGIDSTGYNRRYCYPYEKTNSCIVAYALYNGIGDPQGHWLVRKGAGGDYRNPNIKAHVE